MNAQLASPLEAFRTVFTRGRTVRLTMTLQFGACRERLSTVQTAMRFRASKMNRHVTTQTVRLGERRLANVASVRFMTAVDSSVNRQTSGMRKPFSASGTLVRFLTRMTGAVSLEIIARPETSAAVRALVFTLMNIHVVNEAGRRRKPFSVAYGTRIHVFFGVNLLVMGETVFLRKPFVADRTRIWRWLAIVRITVRFVLYVKQFRRHKAISVFSYIASTIVFSLHNESL